MTHRESFEAAVEEIERQYNLGAFRKKQQEYFDKFRDKPFWIPDEKQHAPEYDRTKAKHGEPRCCAWHIIGCPSKEGRGPLPCFDYEWDLYRAIEEKKYVWVKKSAGLGLSTFMLFYIIYKSLTSDLWKDKSVVLLTGPNIDVATSLIKRLKALFPPNVLPETEKTVCEIADTHVQAYPSFNLPSARGLEKPILAWLDEADYFSVGLQDEALITAERYIGKSPGFSIVLTSTAAKPEGLYWNIEKLPENQCLYHRMVMDYTVGLGKIYTESEIAAAQTSVSWPREYLCQYTGVVGNTFDARKIEAISKRGAILEEERSGGIPWHMEKVLSIDPAWTTSEHGSKFAMVMLGRESNYFVEALYAKEFTGASFNGMLAEIMRLWRNCNISRVYIDGSAPELINAVVDAIGESSYKYNEQIKRYESKGWDPADYFKVLPIHFRTNTKKEMLEHLIRMVNSGVLAISGESFEPLLIALRTAYSVEGVLKKSVGAHDDLLDALLMACQHYTLPTSRTAIQLYTSVT